MGGVDLDLGDAVEIAFHVVEEDGEDVRRELVELANLVFEKLDGFVVVLKMEFVEIDPDAEGDSGFPVDFSDFPETCKGDVWQGFVPFFAKEAVAFGGVDVVVVAVLLEEGCVVGTGGPGPLAAEEAFDNAEILHGERSGILGYINYENYGSSGKGAVIDGIFFRFRLRYLPQDERKLAPLVYAAEGFLGCVGGDELLCLLRFRETRGLFLFLLLAILCSVRSGCCLGFIECFLLSLFLCAKFWRLPGCRCLRGIVCLLSSKR